MGRSYTVMAGESLKAIFNILKEADEESSNVFYVKEIKCFYELGKENEDGSITGTIYKFINTTHILPAGNFKIDPEGNILRFYGSTKLQRIEARATALAEYSRIFG